MKRDHDRVVSPTALDRSARPLPPLVASGERELQNTLQGGDRDGEKDY